MQIVPAGHIASLLQLTVQKPPGKWLSPVMHSPEHCWFDVQVPPTSGLCGPTLGPHAAAMKRTVTSVAAEKTRRVRSR